MLKLTGQKEHACDLVGELLGKEDLRQLDYEKFQLELRHRKTSVVERE